MENVRSFLSNFLWLNGHHRPNMVKPTHRVLLVAGCFENGFDLAQLAPLALEGLRELYRETRENAVGKERNA